MTIPQRCKITKVEKSKPTQSSKKCHYPKQQICNDSKYLRIMKAMLTFALPNQFLV